MHRGFVFFGRAVAVCAGAALVLSLTVGAETQTMAAPAQASRTVTPELLLERYASPLSNIPAVDWLPDGSAVVLAAEARRLSGCTGLSGAADHALWIVRVDASSGACAAVVAGRRPLVSPDGRRLAYLTGEKAETRLAVMPIGGGAARDVTQRDAGIGEYYSGAVWSPDSARLMYAFRPVRDEAAKKPAGASSVRVIGGAGEQGDLPPDSELWIADAASGERRQVYHAPALFTDLNWAPDGRSAVFMSRGSFDYHTDGFSAEVDAIDVQSGAVRTIVKDAGVQDLNPSLSPDGRFVAFNYDPNNLYYPYFYRVATVPVGGGTIQPVTDTLWVGGEIRWTPDSRALIFRGKPGAYAQIFTAPAPGASGAAAGARRAPASIVAGPRDVRNVAVSPDGRRLAWVSIDPYGRLELRTGSVEGRDERRLFDFTPEVAQLSLAPVEEIKWKSTDGLEIVGLLTRPLTPPPGGRAPLIVDLHGGPLSGVGLQGRVLLTSPLEWQMWAAKGYAVLHADYRSSGIYGWDKLLAMREKQDEMERDFDDIMAGVDHVVGLGVADPARLGVIGHSAGGQQTNWLITHTNRFKAAVSYEGVSDMFLSYGTGMRVGGNVALEWHYKGKPWDVPQNYRRASALESLKGVTTPTMFVSGSKGLALFHNEMMYTAWKVQGVPVEFLVYDGEGHVISRPENQRDLLTRVVAWMDKWLPVAPRADQSVSGR